MQFVRNALELILMLIAFAFICAVCSIVWPTVKSEMATWAQAIGSVAAICAALWIAHKDTRERRDAERTIALISAVEMSQSATALKHTIQAIVLTTKQQIEQGATGNSLRAAQRELASAKAWQVEEVSRLSPLPDRCALNLAMAQSAIYDCRLLLETSLENRVVMTSPLQLNERARTMVRILTVAVGLLEKSIIPMNEACGWPNRNDAMLRSVA